MWSTEKLMDALGLELHIIQSPMAGASGSAMAAAVCEASGRGSKGFGRFYLAVVGASGCPRPVDLVGRPDPHHR
ncbi:MAG: hypothetical protein VYB59_00770 [Pseudomonadota bacterium]|nr:hypothetical protein [Pseudomonadota bacterium]